MTAHDFATLALIAVQFVAGIATGVVFFQALKWGSRILVEGGAVSTAFALTLGRFLLVGVLLTVAARQGAAPLLAAAVGVFIGRALVMRATEAGRR